MCPAWLTMPLDGTWEGKETRITIVIDSCRLVNADERGKL